MTSSHCELVLSKGLRLGARVAATVGYSSLRDETTRALMIQT